MWHIELIKSYLQTSEFIHILYNYDYNYILYQSLRYIKWFYSCFSYIKLREYNLPVNHTSLFYTKKWYDLSESYLNNRYYIRGH